jgi:DNA-binding transcriptional LysR family regulator
VIDLRRLHHLLVLAEECHFARAAERVHLSQPAFSRSIQMLESQLGMRLFDRETGEVKPTPAGDFIVDRARRLMFDARSLERDLLLYRDSQLGDIAIGAGPFPATTIMPRVIPRLRTQYPNVRVRLEISNWKLLHDRLLAEDIEFFVADVRDLPEDPNVRSESLGRQPAHLFARAGHPLAGTPCTAGDAWKFGIAGTKMPKPAAALLAQLVGLPPGETPVLAFECDDLHLLRSLAVSTDTVIGTSDAACRADVEAGTLVRLQVTDLPDVYSEMGVVTLAHRTLSPMGQRAIECVREVAAVVNVPSH